MPSHTIPPTRCPVCGAPSEPDDRFGSTALRRCGSSACNFTFLDGEVALELYDDRYFEAYAGGDYLAAEQQRRHESRLRIDLLESVAPPPARLLEIGAAAGFFLDEARARGYEGVGVEPNAAMAIHAREELKLDVRTGFLGEVALDPAGFDAACAFHVVEHLPDPSGSLSAIRDALRPGGHLLVEVPNAESAAAERQGSRWKPLDLPYHVGHYGPRSLRTLLERANLEVLRIDTVPFAFYGGSSRTSAMALSMMEALRSRALMSWRAHPSGHQLLRALARRPAT